MLCTIISSPEVSDHLRPHHSSQGPWPWKLRPRACGAARSDTAYSTQVRAIAIDIACVTFVIYLLSSAVGSNLGRITMDDTVKNLYLYIDYHNVIDSGLRKLRDMANFLRRLDELDEKPFKTLISYGGQTRNEDTLKELSQAGVLNSFNQIVFTRQRTSEPVRFHYRTTTDYRGLMYRQTYICHKGDFPRPVTHETINYIVFRGGKDEYILGGHATRYNDAILFVDDRAETLRAVCEPYTWTMTPRPYGIEMNPRYGKFQTARGARYKQCTTLNECIDLITKWCKNGGCFDRPKTPKRLREIAAEERERPEKTHRASTSNAPEIGNDAAQDTDAMLQSHLATLGVRSPNPSKTEVLDAYAEILTGITNEDDERTMQQAFQFVWTKLNNYPA